MELTEEETIEMAKRRRKTVSFIAKKRVTVKKRVTFKARQKRKRR